MRTWLLTFVAISTVTIGACNFNKRDVSAGESDRRHREEVDSAAEKAGRAAHRIAKETGEVAKKAGKELKNAAQGVKEGWKEAEREDQLNPKKN